MRDNVARFMQFTQVHRVWQDRRKLALIRTKLIFHAWVDYRKHYPQDEFLPNHIEISRLPRIRFLLQANSWVVLTRDDVRAAFDLAKPYISIWQSDHLMLLTRRMSRCISTEPGIAGSPELLKLAVCVFSCSDPHFLHPDPICSPPRRRPMWFPEVLHHSCNDIKPQCMPDALLESAEYAPQDLLMRAGAQGAGFRRCAWFSEHLEHHHDASRIVRHLLVMCGFDPARALTTELDVLDPRFACTACGCSDDGKPEDDMSWRHTVGEMT